MSIHRSNAVWEYSKVQTAGGLLVHLALANYANEEGLAYPSIATLARKTRQSPRNVKRALGWLERNGEVEVLKNRGPHGVNLYRLLLGDKLSPGGDICVIKGVTNSAPGGDRVSPNPSSEPLVKENRHSLVRGDKLSPLGEGFALFSKAFPRKQNMKAAERVWRQLKPDSSLVTRILQGIEQAKQSDQWARSGGRYIPAPARWLQDEGWNDEYPSLSGPPIGAVSESQVTCIWGVETGHTKRPCGEPAAPHQARPFCQDHLMLRQALDRKLGRDIEPVARERNELVNQVNQVQ